MVTRPITRAGDLMQRAAAMQAVLGVVKSPAARPALFDMAPRFVAAALQLPGSCLAALDIPAARLARFASLLANMLQVAAMQLVHLGICA